MDWISTVKIKMEKCLKKDGEFFAAFMALEKAYNRGDRKCLWDALRICGHLCKSIKFFCLCE